ncbi:zinc finger protein 2-like isoform X2 [Trichoplusia ni]|uniref:Zinc finger protein 2-like isoform X2 n=1 Tax=Trichoplusia ni TaxID=7111 RepID=A0A7E5V8F0_TRINI|nr:zinc finger protein 2-like isoform X2 [Trichoplusia ni]
MIVNAIKLLKIIDNFRPIFFSSVITSTDTYPQYLCSYCCALVIKCVNFRDRCQKGYELLKYAEINGQSINQLKSLSSSNPLPYTATAPEVTDLTEQVKTEPDVKQEPDLSDEEPLSNKVKKKFNYEENEFDDGNDFSGAPDDNELGGNEFEVIILTKEEQHQEILARKESYNYLHSYYKCDLCYKGFIQDVTYRNHMRRHDPSNGPSQCDICHTRWPDARSLKSHTTASHERKYICKICNHITKSSFRAKEHLKWHSGYKFVCKLCGMTFAKSTSHLTHLRTRHPSDVNCDVCGESFLGEVGLNMHKKKSHRGYEQLNLKLHLKCVTCGVQFKCVEALKKHVGDFENGVCDRNISSCYQCGENIKNQELLKDHIKTHEVAVRCEECNRNFAHERSFAVHYQRVHLGYNLKPKSGKERPRKSAWVCEICGKKCMSNATLIYHQRAHTGEKPFQCSECPKKFSVFQRLQIHLRTHTGERPFKCSSCPKAFKHKAALNRHDRVHSGVKPYQCGHCAKTFSQSNSMKLHVRTVHLKMPAPYRGRRNKTE